MTTRTKVLEVSGQEAQQTATLLGNRLVRAIFVVEEAMEAPSSSNDVEALLAEMDAHAVHAEEVDDSREAIYTRREGEGGG